MAVPGWFSLSTSDVLGGLRAISLSILQPRLHLASRQQQQRRRAARRRQQRRPLEPLRPLAAAASARALLLESGMTPQQGSLLAALVADFAIQLVGWAIAATLKTDKTYDGFGSLTFFALSAASLVAGGVFHWRQVMVSAMVCLWAARLGSYLVYRAAVSGGDSRLEPVKTKPGAFLVYWLVQGVWVFVTLLPVLLVNSSATPLALMAGARWSDGLGALMWAAGFAMETVADGQKWAFKKDPANKGRYIDTGLWSRCRYPNYGGEMLVWAGVFTACAAGIDSPWGLGASLLSPLFTVLILTSLSGIPIQERQAQQRWGSEAEYQEYRRRTRLLLPLPKLG